MGVTLPCITVGEGDVYLVGDSHLSCVMDAEFDRFYKFVDAIEHRATAIFLLGDIFDFYFRFTTSFTPSHYRKLQEKLFSIASQKPVVYLPGNHDFWLGKEWERAGVYVWREGGILNYDDKRYFVLHGDRLDWKAKRDLLLKHPLPIFLFSLLPPMVGYSIGMLVSSLSDVREKIQPPEYLRRARMLFKEGDWDGMILGHVHFPMIDDSIVMAGDWETQRTYVVLNGDGVRIERWTGSL